MGRVLNRAEFATGIWSAKVAVCGSCLAVTRFVAEPFANRADKKSFRVIESERIASGGETARFLEHAKSAAADATLTAFHASAVADARQRWLLRLPDALPHVRRLFDHGATLTAECFGKLDGEIGCMLVEALAVLPLAAEFVAVPGGAEQDLLESSSTGIMVRRFAAGRAGTPPVFPAGSPSPKAMERAVCLSFPLGPVSGKHELVAVPPDLLVPA